MINDWYNNDMIYGYIYKTTLPDLRYYIRQKKGSSIDLNYWGSSKHLNNWFLKYLGFPSNNCLFKLADDYGVEREILAYAWDQDELNLLERHFISDAKVNDCYDECLNIHAVDKEHFIKNLVSFMLHLKVLKKENRQLKRKENLVCMCFQMKQD